MDSFGIDDLFLITIILVFLLTLSVALVRRLRKDKCLRLMHDHHVTFLAPGAAAIWGDMKVCSQGMVIQYDSPFVNSRKLSKTGFLLYEDELMQALAICRTVHGLTRKELRQRESQIARSFNPGFWPRLVRRTNNLVNMVRDAIMNTMSLAVGRMSSRGTVATAMQSQQSRLGELGGSLLDLMANAYEPLLEQLIGKPVILEILLPKGSPTPSSEFPGYLVDYNEKFIALFSPSHEAEAEIDLETEVSADGDGCRVEITRSTIHVVCTARDIIIVQKLILDEVPMDLAVVLLPGQRLTFNQPEVKRVHLLALRTRRVDLICPRSRARIRFSSSVSSITRKNWSGVAPQSESPQEES
jgi:hypothetical protein